MSQKTIESYTWRLEGDVDCVAEFKIDLSYRLVAEPTPSVIDIKLEAVECLKFEISRGGRYLSALTSHGDMLVIAEEFRREYGRGGRMMCDVQDRLISSVDVLEEKPQKAMA